MMKRVLKSELTGVRRVGKPRKREIDSVRKKTGI